MPRIVFGTSCLGNLYTALPWETKRSILQEIVTHVPTAAVLDSAGKYGAGMALESIGRGLRELAVPPDRVVISNKLGWLQTPLRGPEPTFEPGAWAGLDHDAEQHISHDGILRCWEQGCALLGAPYVPHLVSVHDPDEYLARAADEPDRRRRWDDVLGAYRALAGLKARGIVKGVGVGSKDWRVIHDLADVVSLDWVMLACSLTVFHHPPELLAFVEELRERGIGVVNSAVFHAGFLTGGRYFDYRIPNPQHAEDQPLFAWRERFLALCRLHDVEPAAACVEFGLSVPGTAAVALNTGKPERIAENVALAQATAPRAFWLAMKDGGLMARNYPWLG